MDRTHHKLGKLGVTDVKRAAHIDETLPVVVVIASEVNGIDVITGFDTYDAADAWVQRVQQHASDPTITYHITRVSRRFAPPHMTW